MSLYGYTTGQDLSGLGPILYGIVLAALVNVFIAFRASQLMILVVGVQVFTGLTARDTQRIKEAYIGSDADGTSILDALTRD
jgi:FtsH-binding integral membrane protein